MLVAALMCGASRIAAAAGHSNHGTRLPYGHSRTHIDPAVKNNELDAVICH